MSDSTPQLEQLVVSQAQKEVTANGLFDAVSPASFGGRHAEACSGLTWAYYGGRWSGTLVANGTLTITTSTTAYIVADRATGVITHSTATTNWNNTDDYARLYKVVAGASTITSYEDHRAGAGGTTVGAAGGGGDALVANPLSQFAATTSSQLAGVISDETGSGALVFAVSPTLTGSPTAPTQTPGDNSTKMATTAYVEAAVAASGGLTNFTEAVATAAPNNVVAASSFTALNAATNVDIVLKPKGTGAILGHIPDSSSTGGNKRGAGSVDLQITRSVADQVASGVQATIAGGNGNKASGNTTFIGGGTSNVASSAGDTVGGGQSNTASGGNSTVSGGGGSGAGNTASSTGATVCGGQSNTASGTYSTASGSGCTASGGQSVAMGNGNLASGTNSFASGASSSTMGLIGANAHASGNFASSQFAQRVEMVLRATTTNATQTALTADGSTAGTTNQLVLVNSSAYIVRGLVIARENATGDCASWDVLAVIRRGANAAATAMVAAATVAAVANDAGASTWALAVDADTTNGALRLRFTGQAAKTVRTVAVLTASQTVA